MGSKYGNASTMRILFLGDIISKVGRRAVSSVLHGLKERMAVDVCIGNVENAAGLFGITEKVIDEISASGVDIMTSGNHVWDKREGVGLLDLREDLLRPANYPPGVPGRGFLIKDIEGCRVGVVNLQGRTFMIPIDCPFRSADVILSEMPSDVKVVIVDFHAEATSEKLAMGFHLDGRVSAVIGTHTHVPTADERILPKGTAYITDVGMVGPVNSVIGVKKEQIINRFLFQVPTRFKVANEAPCINALLIEIDGGTGYATDVKRITEEIEE